MYQPPNAPPPGGYGLPPPAGGFGYGPPPGMGPLPMMHAPYGIDPITGMPFSDKSRVAAGLLSIFVGSFGVGRFYTGHVGLGVAQLAITVLTCGVLGWVWPVVDGIMMLTGKVTDAQGRPLRE